MIRIKQLNKKVGLLLATVYMGIPGAQAASTTFLLDYSGEPFLNSAKAHGSITFADSQPPNPSEETLLFPDFKLEDFSLTVSGASVGNGNFDLSHFDYFSWNTKGVELELSRDLVGQSTVNGLLWASEEGAGGFGLGAKLESGAPISLQWYVLATNGGQGDLLRLTSFAPVPIPAAVWLFGSALAGIAAFSRTARVKV